MTDEKYLKRLEETVVACNRCGFCTSYCPTYIATGSETHSPRGRNQMFRALLEGKISNPDHLLSSIDTCLLCGECTSICFSEVPTADLMVQARAIIRERKKITAIIKFFFNRVLPFPARLAWLFRILFLAKRLKISWFLQKTGILKRWIPFADAAEDLVDFVPLRFLKEYPTVRSFLTKPFHAVEMQEIRVHMSRTKDVSSTSKVFHNGDTSSELKSSKKSTSTQTPDSRSGDNRQPLQPDSCVVGYVPPCGCQYLRPSIGLATLALFNKLKLKVEIPDLLCCGLPAASYGVIDSVRLLAEENIKRLEKGGYEFIVIDDSSCAAHMKDYPKYFPGDAAWLARSQVVSQKVKELSSFLVSRKCDSVLSLKAWQGGKIAYHDPCKAQYAQRLVNPPRELLSAIRNLQVVPIGDADQCCGGGGTYSLAQPELSRSVLNAKIKNIISSQASYVVTSSTSCLIQVAYGLRCHKSSIQALHLSEFLTRAIDRGY